MANEEKGCKCNHDSSKAINCGGAAGGLYGLGFVGAFVYFIQNADTFVVGLFGFVKYV